MKNAGMLFLNILIIPTVAQESQNNKFPEKLTGKKFQIIRSLEI